jgi:hypothetical protein
MSTELVAAPPGGLSRLHGDERGAILVMGIFMCACMVGALWYLAGIGDAIVYRERMQEGADAVAFSGAVLLARGMNIIVMLNLIMALILAIRVALKATQAGLYIAAAIAAAVPGGQGVAAGIYALANGMNVPINATRPVINQTIKALHLVQDALQYIVPPAALAGSYQIGTRYRPIVRSSAATSPRLLGGGLPIRNDGESKLCQKAGEAVATILGEIIRVPPVPGVSKLIGKAVKKGGFYFCEIGSGGAAPDFSEEIDEAAKDGCKAEKEQAAAEARRAEERYDAACRRMQCNGAREKDLSPAEESELMRLQSQIDAAQRKLAQGESEADCRERKRREINRGFTTQQPEKQRNSNGQGMVPKRMEQNFRNGIDRAQVIAVAEGNFDSLRKGGQGVKVGSWRTPITIEAPLEARFAVAQAEFFFDCRGPWTADDCNGRNNDGNAMWRMRWRARLRRYDDRVGGVLSGARAFAEVLRIRPENSVTRENAALLFEVGRIAASGDFVVH